MQYNQNILENGKKAKLQERIYNIILGSNTSIYVCTLFHVIRIGKKKNKKKTRQGLLQTCHWGEFCCIRSKGGFSFSDQLFSTLSTFFTSVHTLLINEPIEILNSLPSGFPGGSNGKKTACNVGHPGSIPGLGRFPWRMEWQPIPVFLSGEFHGQRPGKLQLMGSQRVGYNWASNTHTTFFTSVHHSSNRWTNRDTKLNPVLCRK